MYFRLDNRVLWAMYLGSDNGVLWAMFFGFDNRDILGYFGFRYLVKTYHHSSQHPRGGVEFTLQYRGSKWNPVNRLKQSADPTRPNPPLTHTEIVTSDGGGNITLLMRKVGGRYNAHMNLNGLEISKLDDGKGFVFMGREIFFG